MSNRTFIIKADGRKVPFNPNKIIRTCRRAGASKEITKHVIKKIRGQIYRGMETRDIYKMVLSALDEEKEGKTIKQRYQLKDAIMKLGPAGFLFENYVGEILKYSGYKIKKIRGKVKGECITHEIDVMATTDNKKILIECKYHSKHGVYTGLKESLYTHARFLDTSTIFDDEYLFCNTKVSNYAKRYAKCVGQQIFSWHYPINNSIETMIEKNNLYPITILNLTKRELEMFSKNNIILAKDLLNFTAYDLSRKTGIHVKRIQNFQKSVVNLNRSLKF